MPRDIEFNSAFSNVLIYVFRINDEDHKGYLKIGKATIKADRATVPTLVPNCSLMVVMKPPARSNFTFIYSASSYLNSL